MTVDATRAFGTQQRFVRIGWWIMTLLAVPVAFYAITLQDGRGATAQVFGAAWVGVTTISTRMSMPSLASSGSHSKVLVCE